MPRHRPSAEASWRRLSRDVQDARTNLRGGSRLRTHAQSRSLAIRRGYRRDWLLSLDEWRGDAYARRMHHLGIRENWPQFAMLVLINACVGGMVGLERTVVPLVATEEFHLTSDTLIFSFIVAFGVVQALSNVAAGLLADRFTRKTMLVSGWLIGLPVPFLLAWGPSWTWFIVANVLLGANQGFTWSMTVTMKNDLVGSRQRGLAMGFNEFAGYGGLGVTALLTGYIAARTGLRPEPFYIGIVYAVVGLALSVVAVRDTTGLV